MLKKNVGLEEILLLGGVLFLDIIVNLVLMVFFDKHCIWGKNCLFNWTPY